MNPHSSEPCDGQERRRVTQTTPLGTATRARLVFATGAAGVTLQADAALPDLYRARFEQHIPSVRVQGGTVTIQYRHFSFFDWLADWRRPLAELTLNGALPWEIEVREGLSNFTADLRGLQLIALDVGGGASEVAITLPQPSGAAYLRIVGGVNNVRFTRPAGVAIRFRIGGGANSLTVDGQHFAARSAEARWETPDFKGTADRYEIEVVGGASNLVIGTY